MQVLYLGRAPHTKETLLDFREKYRVTRHSRVFRGLTGSQRTPGFGASHIAGNFTLYDTKIQALVDLGSTHSYICILSDKLP